MNAAWVRGFAGAFLVAAAVSALWVRYSGAQTNGDAAGEAAPTPAEAGRILYKANCAHCHGPNMVNSGTVSFDLRKFPPDQAERFVTSVTNGKGGMPSWKGVLTDQEISELFAYVLTGGK
jgi:mono/diheme cytochrome c family protein